MEDNVFVVRKQLMNKMFYGAVLKDAIKNEKLGRDYIYGDLDRKILQSMLHEINQITNINIHYLAEIDAFTINGAGNIMARYINQFESETIRAYLVPQIVSDKVENCDRLILDLYLHFKKSDAYISNADVPAPAHIYVRYDNAFKRLKPQKLKKDLMELAFNPRDAFYLPFTVQMLASWKIPELKNALALYLDGTSITAQSVGLRDTDEKFYPPLAWMKRELRFTAIHGLRYYPTADTIALIEPYVADVDSSVRAAAKKTLKVLKQVK